MSVTGKRGVGIPIVLLHDGEGSIVTIEVKTGDTYRGYLDEAEDNMNCVVKDATVTNAVSGAVTNLDYVFIRGSQIVFIIFPNMLKLAPMFRRIKIWKKHKGHPPAGGDAARGQAAAIIRKAQERQGNMSRR
uniref:Small nuclear ribonucleoprotein Sm D3 n=1 Tax=Florenciella parvula TaxID=236787 RepID=A0A7S2CK57_9STRA|mmetsp:Transcript_30177/g.61659  ORF Transcript_30177/g.61659 Transcript_30177/m.61659 type:complete len:132 (+) Transcript_30177:132-527(+)